MKTYNSINEYILAQTGEVKHILEEIRRTISETAPQATEVISYGMPAFRQNGILVYFAAFKNHIGFYCLPSGNKAFQEELKEYKTGKGSIQFPYNKPIPYPLIKKIVNFRLKEDADVHKAKSK
ncbi:MAG: DUF1801 domain-containing protein [Ginsengibacter sp.]